MRRLRRILPYLLTPLGLLAVLALLMGGPKPTYADGPTEPGMAEPGMGDAPAPEAEDPDDEDPDTPQQLVEKIEKAIKNGVKWLKQAQLPDGSWGLIQGNAVYGGGKEGNEYKHPAGATALALYALLKCKESVDDPVIKKGFKYLKDKYKMPGSSYETSMVLLAVTARADPFKRVRASETAGERVKLTGDDRRWAQDLTNYLLKKREKAKKLGWRYNTEAPGLSFSEPPGGNQDLSSTQLAALALLAAERCGIKTESKVWNEIITFSMQQQQEDGPEWDRAVYDSGGKLTAKDKDKPAPGGSGDKERYGPAKPPEGTVEKDKARGFSYIKSDSLPVDEGGPTGGMTACGVGNIMMARYVLMKRDDPMWGRRDQKLVQRSVYDGLAWLDMNWSPFNNPLKQRENVYHIYYMYCCERAYDLVGNRLLGKHYWYAEMAEQLVNRQDQKGFWDSNSTHKPEKVLDTSFALLFLKRATKGGIPFPSVTGGGDEPPVDNRGK
jgi:hypothetical protein